MVSLKFQHDKIHTQSAQSSYKTKKKKKSPNALGKYTAVLCCTAFTVVLSCVWPAGCRLNSHRRLAHQPGSCIPASHLSPQTYTRCTQSGKRGLWTHLIVDLSCLSLEGLGCADSGRALYASGVLSHHHHHHLLLLPLLLPFEDFLNECFYFTRIYRSI